MQIELRGIKHSAFASEETPCFGATVYLDGEKAGTVSNHGRGGACLFFPITLKDRLDAYASTLPIRKSPSFNSTEGKPWEYQPNAETLIFDLLHDHLLAKELRRKMKGRILFVSGEKVMMVKAKVDPQTLQNDDKLRRQIEEHLHTTCILNVIPFDEALHIYRKAVGI